MTQLKNILSRGRSLGRDVSQALRGGAKDERPAYPPDFDASEQAILEAVRPFTMTSPERIVSLKRAVDYIVDASIPGEIVECGVWKGGSMMAAALALGRFPSDRRELLLFDTFDGMPPPSAVDQDIHDVPAKLQLEKEDRSTSHVWAVAQFDEVRRNLERTGYPMDRIHMIRGKVEDTIPLHAPEKIALLRLDTDWFESTHHELVHLFPRLAVGGILIIDDYGHWKGAKEAVDRYFAENSVRIFLSRIDYTGRLAVKLA